MCRCHKMRTNIHKNTHIGSIGGETMKKSVDLEVVAKMLDVDIADLLTILKNINSSSSGAMSEHKQ